MRKLQELLSYFPFIGKIIIEPSMLGLYNALTPRERLRKYLGVSALLLLSAVAHGIQAWMGIDASTEYVPAWAGFIFVSFVIVNVWVVVVHLYLLYRATVFYFFTRRYPRLKRSWVPYSFKEEFAMVLFTGGCQFVFYTARLVYV